MPLLAREIGGPLPQSALEVFPRPRHKLLNQVPDWINVVLLRHRLKLTVIDLNATIPEILWPGTFHKILGVGAKKHIDHRPYCCADLARDLSLRITLNFWKLRDDRALLDFDEVRVKPEPHGGGLNQSGFAVRAVAQER